jgi:glutathionylspermidine synthase
MPKEARKTINGENEYWYKNFGDILANAIATKVEKGGTIMMIHCTCYSDDRQVMQFLGDKLKSMGFSIIYAAADHLRFKDNEAISILDGNEGKVDGIFRFTPLEWLKDIRPKHWDGYFDTTTPSCNHPIAIFAQTKRFPLIWDVLEKNGVSLSTWRELLPETIEVEDVEDKIGYIYKPACGRVGEKISIQEACSDEEYKMILEDVRKNPEEYLAQRKFNSKPLISENGETFHVCLGSYSVEGKHAGFYARISKTPRIDSNAADIPVLIERG